MNNINYKIEVHNLNPSYRYYWWHDGIKGMHTIRIWTGTYFKTVGSSYKSELKAWQSAYENLKKEGRIL